MTLFGWTIDVDSLIFGCVCAAIGMSIFGRR